MFWGELTQCGPVSRQEGLPYCVQYSLTPSLPDPSCPEPNRKGSQYVGRDEEVGGMIVKIDPHAQGKLARQGLLLASLGMHVN
jgi:hypothetical protein